MKHVSILVPAGEAVLSSIVGSFKILSGANGFLMQSGMREDPCFSIDFVGLSKETSLYDGVFSIHPNKTIDEVEKTDLIIITTIIGDVEKELDSNAPFINWIKEQRAMHGTEVASLCVGAFLLAETGLLNGKSCTTHWAYADQFRERYPKVNLLGEKIICEESGIYSSGGAYSFLNLLLHLVEKNCGREASIWCSKMFEIEFDRSDQQLFSLFHGQKSHSDEAVKGAQLYIENNFEKKISVEKLAEMFSISRRNFVRRFKKATANTPSEYIQRVKIEAAKRSLENSPQNVSEVMYRVGYNDTRAFRTVFKKYTGLSPKAYRSKYNREMANV